MGDLEEQLKVKTELQQQLTLEKDKLEMKLTNTSNEVDRMSRNVEALQWRVRNQFAVPEENLTDEKIRQEFQENQDSPNQCITVQQVIIHDNESASHLDNVTGNSDSDVSVEDCEKKNDCSGSFDSENDFA